MRKSAKLITALSVAGLAVAAGSAFTGTGLATTGTAASAQFVGGTVTQSVSGATLQGLVYGFVDDTTKTAVDQVTLTFAAGVLGKIPTVELTGGAAATFTCSAVDAAGTSVCNAAAATSQTGVTSAAVTVS